MNDFINTKEYQAYANNPFTMNHEIAHKKVIDHFFPNDPAEIINRNGRPMTTNKWMRNANVKAVAKNKNMLDKYEKILVAGYVQEIIDLGLEDKLDQILDTQMQNVKNVEYGLIQMRCGFQALFENVYTNDDGKFLYFCKEAGVAKDVFKRFKAAGKWCLEFLKAA